MIPKGERGAPRGTSAGGIEPAVRASPGGLRPGVSGRAIRLLTPSARAVLSLSRPARPIRQGKQSASRARCASLFGLGRPSPVSQTTRDLAVHFSIQRQPRPEAGLSGGKPPAPQERRPGRAIGYTVGPEAGDWEAGSLGRFASRGSHDIGIFDTYVNVGRGEGGRAGIQSAPPRPPISHSGTKTSPWGRST